MKINKKIKKRIWLITKFQFNLDYPKPSARPTM